MIPVIRLSTRLGKAFGAKDFSKLVPIKEQDTNGVQRTVWKLPDDAKQRALFSPKDEGQGNAPGKRGYIDHVDEGTQKHMVDPLVKTLKDFNPDLAGRIKYKYDKYQFDRDTRELDIKHDYEMAWYLKKIKDDPEHKADWQEEYNQKTDKLVAQINNRKAAMLKVKKGQKVNYYGKPAVVADFSHRGFPVLKTQGGEVKALWEEISA